MSLTGTGVIAIWHDISADGLQDFYEWHNREHIPERVGIDGFQRGRRYDALAGAPEFFTLYNVRDLGVLAGAAYHARLNDPTPWTLRAVGHFSNEARSLCKVEASAAWGRAASSPPSASTAIPAATRRSWRRWPVLRCAPSWRRRRSPPCMSAGPTSIPAGGAAPSRRIAATTWCRAGSCWSRAARLPRSQAVVADHLGPARLAALGVPDAPCSIYGLQHDLVKGFG